MVASHTLFHTIHQLSRLLTKHANKALQPFGLYSAQWSVIYVLKTKGALTQKELGDYLSVEAPPLTRNIQRLVKLGFVQQSTGSDKRSKVIELTDLASQEYSKWENAIKQTNQELLQHLPENDREQLHGIITSWIGPMSGSKGAEHEKSKTLVQGFYSDCCM
ncbi:MarR family transcriptional regulator [Jeotgalibacillus sp. S-D1]|nr:MarR family transcriptional regulator [Jeotgalibacillus sp. S-D1]